MQTKNTPSSEQYDRKKLLSFLTALCLFFSAIELALPKPFPFIRLGLANAPIILSLFILPPSQFFILVLLKIFVQNLISGTLFSYTILFSVAGSLASSLIMFSLFKLLYRRNLISLTGISLAGALFNSLAQLLVSYFFIFNENTKFIAPFLLASSFITGLFLGLAITCFTDNSEWFSKITSNSNYRNLFSGDKK